MRILLTGSKSFGAAVFNRLISDGHDVDCVCCPVGDKKDKLSIAVSNSRTIKKVIKSGFLDSESCPEGIDLIVAAHSHDFVGKKTRDAARHGAIGYHPSLLPLHRGRDAVKWTAKMGDKVAGGTVYWLSETVDGGAIAAQRHVVTGGRLTAKELWGEHLFGIGVELISGVCADIANGEAMAVPQDHSIATWEPSIGGQPLLYRPDLLMIGGDGLKRNVEGTVAR